MTVTETRIGVCLPLAAGFGSTALLRYMVLQLAARQGASSPEDCADGLDVIVDSGGVRRSFLYSTVRVSVPSGNNRSAALSPALSAMALVASAWKYPSCW